jgi:hypothetical protein
MPWVMMGMIFFLARIEERHLTARPVIAVIPSPAEGEPVIAADRS